MEVRTMRDSWPTAAVRILLRAALVTCLLGAGASQAQWYLLLAGEGGGISSNSGTVTQGVTDRTRVWSYGQNLFLPLDAQGVPGALELRPLRVVKDVDGSSPRIAKALATGEEITACSLGFYDNSGGGGALVLKYEIVLGNPTIIGAASGGTDGGGGGGFGTETVTILFESVTLTDINSGQTSEIP